MSRKGQQHFRHGDTGVIPIRVQLNPVGGVQIREAQLATFSAAIGCLPSMKDGNSIPQKRDALDWVRGPAGFHIKVGY